VSGNAPARMAPPPVRGHALVTCIVPVYNGERFLLEALASVAAQSYRPLEILLVDDGSTDRTPEVAATSGIDLVYLRQENAGGPAARNLGIDKAQGEFVAFLDADDRWRPEKLDRQMARFAARPELDISLAHVQNFWMPDVVGDRARLEGNRRTEPIPGYTAGTLLVRRGYFDRLGRFNAAMRHGEQTEWFVRAREAGAVIEVLEEVLLERRLHGQNVSRLRADASLAQYFELLKGVIDRRRSRSGA